MIVSQIRNPRDAYLTFPSTYTFFHLQTPKKQMWREVIQAVFRLRFRFRRRIRVSLCLYVQVLVNSVY